MQRPLIKGSFKPGESHELRPAGTLAYSRERELLVTCSSGAYNPDGAPAWDTRRRLGKGAYKVDPGQMDPVAQDIGGVVNEEVIWAGSMTSQFGHFLVESVSRLWPCLPEADLAGVPVVFAPCTRAQFAVDWLNAYGAELIDLPEHGAVRFTKMIVPETAWRIGAWLAPEMRNIHLHARRGLELPSVSHPDVLWLSRSKLRRNRIAYDEALLEWLLADQVTILSPETLPLAEQLALLEGSRAITGVIGSAFHALLMVEDLPESLYLCPPWDKGTVSAQHRVLDATATFAHALEMGPWTRARREDGVVFPNGYRLHIPKALRAIHETLLPDLFDDPRLAAFARPEAHFAQPGGANPADDLDIAVGQMLLEPRSIEARLELAEMFEARGLSSCANEQFTAASDLRNDPATAS
jgi:Glycosyltransferase 61